MVNQILFPFTSRCTVASNKGRSQEPTADDFTVVGFLGRTGKSYFLD